MYETRQQITKKKEYKGTYIIWMIAIGLNLDLHLEIGRAVWRKL